MVVKDVTEQRVAERALKESEARFRRIANSAPTMMWVTRLDRVRDFVNDAYVDFVVRAGRRPRGGADARLAHADPSRRRRRGSSPRASPGRRRERRSRWRGAIERFDGEWRWLRSVSQPRFGPDGELVGFIGVASDITLAKEAELELRRQVEEQTARARAVAKRGSARCSTRCSRCWC